MTVKSKTHRLTLMAMFAALAYIIMAVGRIPISSVDFLKYDPKDIILAIDDQRIDSMEDIETILYNYKPGDTVEVIIYRSGRQYQVELVLGESVS